MCCLFGFYDYGGTLSAKQKNRIISALAISSEIRGTDATGIAYRTGTKLCIYKRPFPARWMRFRFPAEVKAVMGHTRMTTQGSEMQNCNNHPFYGVADGSAFALAHNGILSNDKLLRFGKEAACFKNRDRQLCNRAASGTGRNNRSGYAAHNIGAAARLFYLYGAGRP